jgi:hypothetical protein
VPDSAFWIGWGQAFGELGVTEIGVQLGENPGRPSALPHCRIAKRHEPF